MRNISNYLYFLILGLNLGFLEPSWGALPAVQTNELVKLNDIKKNIRDIGSEIQKISTSIAKVEDQLTHNFKKYLQAASERKRIEKMVAEMTKELEANELNLKVKLVNSQKMLKAVLIKHIDSNPRPADLVTKKIIINALSIQIEGVKGEILSNQELKKQIDELSNRVAEYTRIEMSLKSLLIEKEEEKKLISDKYDEQLKKQTYLNSQYDKMRAELSNKKKKIFPEIELSANDRFRLPLESTDLRYKNNGEGIYIGHDREMPLYATNTGTIVFVGDLSTYGKLVMIDHGLGLRSVILGNYKAKVKKGDQVKKGDVIGSTNLGLEKHGEVYFEVRKGSKTQNTSHMI